MYMYNIGKLIGLCQDPPEMELQAAVHWHVDGSSISLLEQLGTLSREPPFLPPKHKLF